MSDSIVRIVNESSPMRSLATVETISSDSLDLIEDTDEMAAAWADETTARSADTNTAAIGRNTIDTFEMYAQPKATQKLIDDAAIDIEQWIAEKVADKFSRLESTAFIAGNGTSAPKGILSYTAGTSFGQVQQVPTGTSAVVTADMPVPAASSLSIAVGDFKRAYMIVDRVGIRTLRDPFTAKPFVQFYTTKRVGGKVVNTEAVKLLKLAVS